VNNSIVQIQNTEVVCKENQLQEITWNYFNPGKICFEQKPSAGDITFPLNCRISIAKHRIQLKLL
jgi:hypothetical protein